MLLLSSWKQTSTDVCIFLDSCQTFGGTSTIMSQSFSFNFNSSYQQTKLDKAMTNEQFEQIVEAILAGKYSWACVLILRSAGYNPLHYIPYRTYNRLIKDNCCLKSQPSESGIPHPTADARELPNNQSQSKQAVTFSNEEPENLEQNADFYFPERVKKRIEHLTHLKDLDYQSKDIRGGSCRWYS